MKKGIITTAILGLFFIGGVDAQDSTERTPKQKKNPAEVIAKFDKNNDGVIDKSEAENHEKLSARFDKIDLNGDGQISSEEIAEVRENRAEKKSAKDRKSTADRIKALDTNADGQISKIEASKNEKLAAKFDDIDTNGDGQLTEAEFKAFKEAKASKRGAKSK